jgi:hypothetical protein
VQHPRQLTVIPAVSLLLPVLCAQGLRFQTPGIPRASDRKPSLAAPYPYVVDVIQDTKDEAIFEPTAVNRAEIGRISPTLVQSSG